MHNGYEGKESNCGTGLTIQASVPCYKDIIMLG